MSTTTVVAPHAAATPTPDPPVDDSHRTTPAGIPWLAFHRHRVACRRRWPSIWSLPIHTSPLAAPRRRGLDVASVLDVGATTRVWEPAVRSLWPRAEYRSLDADRTHQHDYYGLGEVERAFDLILLFEVLEHLDPTEGMELLAQCAGVCRPGGHVLATVPNVLTPGMQLELTHRTAISHLDLGALLTWTGLSVIDAGRLWLGSHRRLFLHRFLFGPLHRALRVDYCQSIVMLAQHRPEDAS